MINDLIISSSLNRSYLLNNGTEQDVKICLDIRPSNEVRNRFLGENNNSGIDLCILLDTSWSMNDPIEDSDNCEVRKIDVAMEACKNLISNVRNQDNITLIVYNESSEIIFENVSGKEKEYMLSKLSGIEIDGATDISTGLRNARMVLNKYSKENIKNIIFLTDGKPTIDSKEQALAEGKYIGDNNIKLDCLGIGDEIEFSLLEKLSIPSGGRTDIIKSSNQASTIFNQLFMNAKNVIITNAVLKFNRIGQNIRVTNHYKYLPEKRYLGKAKLGLERKMEINVGQIEKDQLYSFLFEVKVPTFKDYKGPMLLMSVELEYTMASQVGGSKFKTNANIFVETGDNVENSRFKDGEVDRKFNMVEIKRLEDEIEECSMKEEHAQVISNFQKIIELARLLRDEVILREYTEQLEEYKKTKKINMKLLNITRNSTSKQSESGLIQKNLEQDHYNELIRCIGGIVS